MATFMLKRIVTYYSPLAIPPFLIIFKLKIFIFLISVYFFLIFIFFLFTIFNFFLNFSIFVNTNTLFLKSRINMNRYLNRIK